MVGMEGPGSLGWSRELDAEGRPVRVVQPSGRTVAHGYDDLGRVTSREAGGQEAIRYGYEGRSGLPATIEVPGGPTLAAR